MKDQLFKNKPELNLVIEIIRLFGLKNFDDIQLFTKQNMIELNTVEKMKDYIPRLQEFYLPCKSKIYLQDLNERKCINILRQLLKQYNHTLISKEKYIKSIKYNFHQIIQFSNKKIDTNIQETERKIVLSFD